MIKLKKILVLFFIFFILLSLKVFAVGEEISFNNITTYMPEIVQDIDPDEDPMKEKYNSSQTYYSDTFTNLTAKASSSEKNISNMISQYANTTTAVGIDVSAWQEDIDWKKVADSGVKFAMIRCGYRARKSSAIGQDRKFKQNIEGALNNGISVGVYFYSTALNEEEALQEAQVAVTLIQGYDLKYPVAYDFEDFNNNDYRTDNLSVEQINKNGKIFLEYIASKGYKGCLYGSAYYLNTKWNMSDFSNYFTWVANYNVSKPSYKGEYQIWQCTSEGSVPGILGNVDIDIDYSYLPFKDVRSSDWFYNAVKYTYMNGLISGYNSSIFAPDDKMTRGMIVTILYRMENSPNNNGQSCFLDVVSNEWYSRAVKWAVDNGIVHGYEGTNTFGPNDNIIREDLAGILRNYANYKKKNMNINGSLLHFKDYNEVDGYAIISMEWAVGVGVITGNMDGTLNPRGNATRAEAAAMIQKYCNKVGI